MKKTVYQNVLFSDSTFLWESRKASFIEVVWVMIQKGGYRNSYELKINSIKIK